MTHTRASKIHKEFIQNATKQTRAMCLEENLLVKWQSLGLALVSNAEDSISSVTLLLQVAVWPLWHSAYMSPIGACSIETSSCQLAPEATKELTIPFALGVGTAQLESARLITERLQVWYVTNSQSSVVSKNSNCSIHSDNYSSKFRGSELAWEIDFLSSRGSPRILKGSHQMPWISTLSEDENLNISRPIMLVVACHMI